MSAAAAELAYPSRSHQTQTAPGKSCACGGTPGHDGECAQCRARRLAQTDPSPSMHLAMASVGRVAGEGLEPQTQRLMEDRFGHDFSDVRIHSDAGAASSAQAMGARAYTVGRDVRFAAGEYRPDTPDGRHLLAHELTHVLQQRGAKAGARASDAVGVTSTTPRISRQAPGTISRCREMGVPCPAPHFTHGTVCRLDDCIPAATANLPFAISPGVCIYRCVDGNVCTCVLVGSKTSAVCAITICSSDMSAQADPTTLVDQAVAAAQTQLGGGREAPAGTGAAEQPTAQAKLEISQPGDPLEREADTIADQVVSGVRGVPLPSPLGNRELLQRQPDPSRYHLVPPLTLGPPPPPPPLFRPGDIPEAFVFPALPAPAVLQPPSLLQPPEPRFRIPGPQLTPPALPFSPVTIVPVDRCIPDRPLTWADYAGPVQRSQFDAETKAPVHELDIQGNPMFQARLDNASSWVRVSRSQPTNRSATGVAGAVAQCRTSLASGRTSWSFNGRPSAICPASEQPSSIPAATNAAECDTIIGAEWDRAATAESDRLLHHEQLHMDIACSVANKASDALRAGTPVASLRGVVVPRLNATQATYDVDSAHGCNAAGQATWDARVAGGLSTVTFP